jgi:hypothetical protein|tara:strand:- start:613 stop:828 length:216 start_codon:yes stop_codon:yes gene_type:complete
VVLLLVLAASTAFAQMKYFIQYQDQFGHWRPFQIKHNLGDATRTMGRRASSTGKKHRLVDQDGNLLDLVTP